MATTVRSLNLPAERLSQAAGMRAMRELMAGADVGLVQEVEKYVREGTIYDLRAQRHLTNPHVPELAKRPILFDPDSVTALDPITYPVHLLEDRWPKAIPGFRGWQTGARFLTAKGSEFTVFDIHQIHRHMVGARRTAYVLTIGALAEMAQEITGPIIMGGDWNVEPDSGKLAALKKAGFRVVSPGPTHGGRRRKAIDFFMVRGTSVVPGSARVLPRPPGGDHNPITATFNIA